MSDLLEQARAREWFYRYELPDGTVLPCTHDAGIQAIHDTRWQMLDACLDQRLGPDRGELTALDLASHQGWFALQMARAGFGSVLGIDARRSHVEDAGLIAGLFGEDQLSFRQQDIHAMDTQALGQFDVVLM